MPTYVYIYIYIYITQGNHCMFMVRLEIITGAIDFPANTERRSGHMCKRQLQHSSWWWLNEQ